MKNDCYVFSKMGEMSGCKMSEPNLEATSTKRIHPALDFTSDNAYVGQLLPCKEPYGDQEELFYLIRDDGEIIPYIEDILEKNELSVLSPDCAFELVWSIDGIKNFSKGQEAIDSAQLFNKMKGLFKTYIELEDEKLYDFLALWNIGTYFFPLFNSYPYVYVGGVKDSGKTKLLTLCACIAFNAISSGNLSPAVLYRLIQGTRCSLLLDETESLSNRYRAGFLRNVLLNGYKKGQKIYRNMKTSEGKWVPEPFEVYSPKMLASIERLEAVLGSRCIPIMMKKGLNKGITDKEIDINDPTWQQTRDLIYPFLMKNWRDVRKIYSELENDTKLLNRNWELWKPVLTLAKFFDNENSGLYEKMKILAVEKAEENKRESSNTHEAVLVRVLLSLVDQDNYYSLSEIREEMTKHLESGDWISEKYVGKILRRLGFSKKRRIATGTEYFLQVSEVKEWAQRLEISVDSEGSELSERTEEEGT